MLRQDTPRTQSLSFRGLRAGLQMAVAVPRSIDAYWRDLLDRLGVPTVPFGGSSGVAVACGLGLDPDRDPAGLAQLSELWHAGVTVVASAEVAARLVGRHAVKVRGDRLIGDGFAFEGVGSVPIDGPVIALSASDVPAAVECVSLRPAPMFSLSLPPSGKLRSRRESRRTMTRIGDEPVRCRVSTTDHGRLGRLVRNLLREAFAVRGLPLVLKSTSPAGMHGALALHVTIDEVAAGRRALYALGSARLRASIRLRGAAQELCDEVLVAGHELLREPRVEGFDVGSARAFDALPGAWPRKGATPEQSDGRAQVAWDLPPHSISPRDLVRHGAAPELILDHLREALRIAVSRDEPILLDLDARADLDAVPGVLATLRAALDLFLRSCENVVWQPTLGELHRFFRERAEQNTKVEADQRLVRGDAGGPVPLRVIGSVRRTTVRGSFSLEDLCTPARAPQSVGSSSVDGECEASRSPRFSGWRSRTMPGQRVLKPWSRGNPSTPQRPTGT